MKKRYIGIALGILAGVLLLVWLIPFAHNEILTISHGYEFRDRYREWSFYANDTKAELCKVLNYTENNAEVYYVTQGYDSGQVYYFVKSSERQWQLDKVDTVWAKGGSASEVLWPYFWHIIYSGGM